MQLPHRLVVITPTQATDAYDNPVPQLEYGNTAARRTVWGLLQPDGSTEPAERDRQPVITTWRLFTYAPIAARERVLWQGRTFEVVGEPARWAVRFGRTHYETRLRHVEG